MQEFDIGDRVKAVWIVPGGYGHEYLGKVGRITKKHYPYPGNIPDYLVEGLGSGHWDKGELKIMKRRKNFMTSLRETVRAVLRDPDERLLIRTGFVYESGALTKEGRKILADLQFQGISNDELRAEIVSLANKIDEDETKAAKRAARSRK